MNAEDLIPYLTKLHTDSDLQALLDTLGVPQPPKVPRGDTEARVGLNALGIELIFHPVNDRRFSPLALGTVLVYGNTQGGEFTPYAGPLPSGLAFTDTRDEARRKVGPPAYANEAMDRDTWDFPTYTLTIDYRVGGTGIVYIDLSPPEAP